MEKLKKYVRLFSLMSTSKKPSFEQYLSIKLALGARWHPTEQKFTFVYDQPGSYQVFVADLADNKAVKPNLLTKDENRSTNPRFLPDGTIVYQRDDGGNENFQIYSLDRDGNHVQITDDLGAKHLISSHSKNYLYFIANIENKSRFDIYRIKLPLEANKLEKIYESKQGLPSNPFSINDNLVVFAEVHGNMHQEIILLDIEKDLLTNLTLPLSQGKEYRWQVIRWIDEEHLLVATDYQNDLYHLGILSIDGNYQAITEIKTDFEFSGSAWTENSPYTYVLYNEEGYSSLYRGVFTSSGVNNFEKIDLPIKGVVGAGDARTSTQSIHLSSDGKYLSLSLASPIHPANIWVLNTENKQIWKAVDTDLAGIDEKDLCDASLHRFKSFDDLSVPYFKYLPQQDKPENGWPTIFVIHGGPEAQARPSFVPQLQFFLSAGYAIIVPNIRGSAGYGRTYLDLDNKEKRLDSILDIKNLAIHLREDSDIDCSRLIIFGGSYGGFAVLSAMTEHPELWAAGIDIVGISNFVTFLENTAAWRRKLREVEYGSLEDDYDMLQKISPIHKIDQIKAPLFIIQGDNDERVPLSESIQMYEKLKEKGLDVELLRFADEGHGVTKLKNKIKAYSQVIEFLDRVVN